MHVPGKKLGAVIGVKGVNLKAIQEATGASISTPKGERDNTVPATVTVSGTKDAVAKATRAIKDLATKGNNQSYILSIHILSIHNPSIHNPSIHS